MSEELSAEAGKLLDALTDAYPSYVRRRLAERHIDVDLAVEIDMGVRWLRSELRQLLNTPFHLQRQGPLEVFQAAMAFPSSGLDAAGVAEVERDEIARNALPGDRFDLAPASSNQLGEAVWEAHIVWGAAKTKAIIERRQ